MADVICDETSCLRRWCSSCKVSSWLEMSSRRCCGVGFEHEEVTVLARVMAWVGLADALVDLAGATVDMAGALDADVSGDMDGGSGGVLVTLADAFTDFLVVRQ
jgi:hypothetical protein